MGGGVLVVCNYFTTLDGPPTRYQLLHTLQYNTILKVSLLMGFSGPLPPSWVPSL